MNFWNLNILLSFVISAYLAGVFIPKILLIAFRKNLFDVPDERKIHTSLVPRLGGIAFKPVIFFTLILLFGLNLTLGDGAMLDAAIEDVRSISFVYCAIMLLYMVGIGDDLVGIRYRAKFILQIISAILLIAGGMYINDFHGLFAITELNVWFAYPFTILIVVFIINAMNLIDGIDGLASGLSSVAMIFYAIIFYIMGEYLYSLISVTTLGVLLPFFYYNVFGNPEKQKKIFMGDTGSLTIGTMICFLSFKMAMTAGNIGSAGFNPLILAFSPLLIPCLDVVRVYWGRVRRGNNPFLPDKTHIHHKLLAVGMCQHAAMITILSVSVIFILGNILLSYYLNITFILVLDILIWTLSNIWLTQKRKAIEDRCVKEIIK